MARVVVLVCIWIASVVAHGDTAPDVASLEQSDARALEQAQVDHSKFSQMVTSKASDANAEAVHTTRASEIDADKMKVLKNARDQRESRLEVSCSR